MAAAKKVIWILPLLFVLTTSQHLGLDSIATHGICQNAYCYNTSDLRKLRNCVVVLGNLRIALMETTSSEDFEDISFPNLREVTGFVVAYRVRGLDSLGRLFPNLSRIRGLQLINNYGLIVYDMFDLRNVGLHSLLRVDRGGVYVWGGPHTCYVNTIDWNAIAPRSRHLLTYPEMSAHCNAMKPCKCNANKTQNYCWQSKKCQRFVSGPQAETCHPECLGCRGSPDICSVCRHFTYRGRCVKTCPADTIVLPDNQYCVTKEECRALKGWSWNNSCVFECPVNYYRKNDSNDVTCERCFDCQKVCSSLLIDSLSAVQQATGCVHINGSLIIHVRSVPGIVAELIEHLSLIETIEDYVMVFGSQTIKSLNFLPSLNHIGGKNLRGNTYSLIIYDMQNLEELFTPNVMRNITIGRGRLQMHNNPKLCLNKMEDFIQKFPEKSNSTDVPPMLNGYSGGCEDSVGLKVQVLSETAANVTFSPHMDPDIHYSVLYTRVPKGIQATPVPETCRSEWVSAHTMKGQALLTSLRPASTYAVCIETYAFSNETLQTYIARTTIVNFETPFKKPEPPFIQELLATSPNVIQLRWIDHKDYRPHITHYQLDVMLIEIPDKDLRARDHCDTDIYQDSHDNQNRHALVLKTPKDYDLCEPNCVTLARTSDTFAEEPFDICSSLDSDCDYHEDPPPRNSSFRGYVRTLSIDIKGQIFLKVKGLAPYRDYKLRLRACAGEKCSRSNRQVIRTLRSSEADVPSAVDWTLNENGEFFVKWKPPDITNGPIFSYTFQMLSVTIQKQIGTIIDTVCVYPEQLNVTIRLKTAKEYSFRICSATLGSLSACTEWHVVPVIEEYNIIVIAVISSVILAIVSTSIAFCWNSRNDHNDTIPLVDATSIYRNESDPPNVAMLSFLHWHSMMPL